MVGKLPADVSGNVCIVFNDQQLAGVFLVFALCERCFEFRKKRFDDFRRSGCLPFYGVMDGNTDVESGTFAYFALYRDASSHGIHDLFDECKAHTGPDVLHFVLSLIESLKHMGGRFLVHALACVGNIDEQVVFLAPHRNVYLAVFRGKLEGVGEQVVHQFVYIVGNEVHDHGFLGKKLQVDVATVGIITISFDDHRQVCRDVSVVPIAVSHGRLDF